MTPSELIADLTKVGLGVGFTILGRQWLQARNRREYRREELRLLVACVERLTASLLTVIRQIDKIGSSVEGVKGFFGLESNIADPGDLGEFSGKVRTKTTWDHPTIQIWRKLDKRLTKSQSLFDALRKQQALAGERENVLAQIPNLRALLIETVANIREALTSVRAQASKDTKKAIDKLLSEINDGPL